MTDKNKDQDSVTIKSEDGCEISEAQRKEINDAISWMKNWYKERHAAGLMSDEEYNIAQEKLKNIVVCVQKDIYNLNGVAASGYYVKNGNSNTIHVSLGCQDLGSTTVHEAAHCMEFPESERKCIVPQEMYNSSYTDAYYEVYARLMQVRYRYKLDPKEKLTPENLEYLLKEAYGEERYNEIKKSEQEQYEFDTFLNEELGMDAPQKPKNITPVKPKKIAEGQGGNFNTHAILGRYNDDFLQKIFNETAQNTEQEKQQTKEIMKQDAQQAWSLCNHIETNAEQNNLASHTKSAEPTNKKIEPVFRDSSRSYG